MPELVMNELTVFDRSFHVLNLPLTIAQANQLSGSRDEYLRLKLVEHRLGAQRKQRTKLRAEWETLYLKARNRRNV